MSSLDCVFCSIISGELPASIVAEDEHILVIKDIAPKAPVHLLLIPKVHVKDITQLQEDVVRSALLSMAAKLSQDNHYQPFRLVINTGKDVGQTVFHIHCHYLAGKHMADF